MSEQLVRALIEDGVLSQETADTLPKESLQSVAALEQRLVREGIIDEGDFLKAKSRLFDVPSKALSGVTVAPEVLRLVPENTVERYHIAPLERTEDELVVGMVDPGDVSAREAIKFIAVQHHLTPKIYVISRGDLESISQQYRSLKKEVGKALKDFQKEQKQKEEEKKKKKKKKKDEETEEISEEAPVSRMVAVTIRHAVEGHASDIHIEPLEEKTRVRFRVDGVLHASIFLPKRIHAAIVARIKILSNLKIDEMRKPQDGRFQTSVSERRIDFRVSTFPTAFGEKVVMRILDPSGGVGSFEELGLVGRSTRIYKEALDNPFGLVLITGPTGSGKSTTLYTSLQKLNQEGTNLVTLEDPIEYYIEGVAQSQIRPEIDYTFASGLRHILRQDPDIIMVGEIRDKETASLAIHAALTGHLVFSTLHTNDAIGIVPRLVNMGVEPYLIPPTLIAGVAQRLVKTLCQECKEEIEPKPSVLQMVEEALEGVPEEELKARKISPPYKIYESKGCPACGNKGTKGRMAVFEMFEMTPEFESVLLGTISENKLREEAKRQGMITLKQDGIMKALTGVASIEEVLRVVEE